MPTAVWMIIVAVVLLELLLVPVVIVGAVRSMWAPIAKRFPGVEPEPGAVERRHQSLSVGLLNLGWSVHVAIDERRLHLTPVRLFQALGARPASVPWDDVRVTRLGKRYGAAQIAGQTVRAPAWCLELAVPDRDRAGPA